MDAGEATGQNESAERSVPVALALYQPDIAQNAGTLIRLAACLGAEIHIIEPAGFDASDRNLRRAGMDYLARAAVTRHLCWEAFRVRMQTEGRRLVLMTTAGAAAHTDFAFRAGDVILLGRESAGVPDAVHAAADARLRIPMRRGLRSLNVAVAGAIAFGEALRQTGGFPVEETVERAADDC